MPPKKVLCPENEVCAYIDAKLGQLKLELEESIKNIFSNQLAEVSQAIEANSLNISNLRTDFTNLNDRVSTMELSLNSTKTEMSSAAAQRDVMVSDIDSLKNYEVLLNDLNEKIHCLETQMKESRENTNRREQWERHLNLEVTGVRDSDVEPAEALVKIATHLKVPLTSSDIEFSYKVATRNIDSTKESIPKLIIKLRSRNIKDRILAAVRERKGISAPVVGLKGNGPIYINEHLTPENKFLLKKTKEMAKAKNYKYVWVRYCKIYVRKSDTFPPINIRTIADIDKLK